MIHTFFFRQPFFGERGPRIRWKFSLWKAQMDPGWLCVDTHAGHSQANKWYLVEGGDNLTI